MNIDCSTCALTHDIHVTDDYFFTNLIVLVACEGANSLPYDMVATSILQWGLFGPIYCDVVILSPSPNIYEKLLRRFQNIEVDNVYRNMA